MLFYSICFIYTQRAWKISFWSESPRGRKIVIYPYFVNTGQLAIVVHARKFGYRKLYNVNDVETAYDDY